MIRLGLRLALASGREAAVRLAVIAAAVAVGVALLLGTLAASNAVEAQNARYAWLNTGIPSTLTAVVGAAGPPAAGPAAGPAAADPAWWLLRSDHFRGRVIARVDVAVTGPDSPVPPGVPGLPGPGEFRASPALSALLRTTPTAELGDRFPGREVGTIGAEALPAPDFLLVIVGHRADELAGLPDARQVNRINATDPSECDGCHVGIGADAINLVLSVVAVALIFPVLIFIGAATRLTAARREQRLAAMRLVGATPRQVTLLSCVDAAVAAVTGTAIGFGLFLPLRTLLAEIPFTGIPFFPGDIGLDPADVALVAAGVPVAAVLAAGLALRRVRISPLGVSRRVTPPAPRAWRVIPLVAGIAELAWFVDRRPDTANGQLLAYLSGILLIMVGLVLAGPWLTMAGSRVLARRAARPAALIAARRLADDPKAGFRAVSGLMLALFVTSVATGVITTVVAERGAPRTGSVFDSSLAEMFWAEELAEGEPAPTAKAIPAGLRAIPGVRAVVPVYPNPVDAPDAADVAGYERWAPGVVRCADVARTPEFGRCPAGAETAVVHPDLIGLRSATEDPPVWPAADLAAAGLRDRPVLSFVVNTDGSASALEQVRTMLATAFPQGRFPATGGEFEAEFTRSLVQFQQLANVVILASLPIAGCSLAVSVVGGLSDRRRPFSVLRLTGVPLGTLRRVVALETLVPLLAVAGLAIGLGFLAAQLFLTSQLGYSLRPPGLSYPGFVVAGLVAALGVVAATLPLLRRLTGPEAARND